MRISFDSNAWERIFDPADSEFAPIRDALLAREIKGFICETGFCIEAIAKRDRADYFVEPQLGVRFGDGTREGRFSLSMSVGPNDECHPGLPEKQSRKLQCALAAGIKLMHGSNWLGLPRPQEIRDRTNFVQETRQAAHEREQRQLNACTLIDARGVGKAAFDAAGGWNLRSVDSADQKKLYRACAEWADGEMVAAHIAYQNDVLCTNDHARGAGNSIFDATNRAWLTAKFDVVFVTTDALLAGITRQAATSI